MPSTIDFSAAGLELDPKPELTEEQKKALLEEAIEKRERLADSALEMAKLFTQSGKAEIAQRRLKAIIKEFEGSAAAMEATEMLQGL